MTILGWFWAQFWGRFRYILDTTSEPAQNHEKLDLYCYLLYFRHVADPENDAISEYFTFCLFVFVKALFWVNISVIFVISVCFFGTLLGHCWLTFLGLFFGSLKKGGRG